MLRLLKVKGERHRRLDRAMQKLITSFYQNATAAEIMGLAVLDSSSAPILLHTFLSLCPFCQVNSTNAHPGEQCLPVRGGGVGGSFSPGI